jgi:uncharacterized protein DUF3309
MYDRAQTRTISETDNGRADPRLKQAEKTRRKHMSLGMILLIVLVLALLGVIPTWPHSKSWGYAPGGMLGLVVVVVLVLVVSGHI